MWHENEFHHNASLIIAIIGSSALL